MPAKNSVKRYVPGGYYHLYNRGAFKLDIFRDDQDYRTLLSQFPRYLLPPDQPRIGPDPHLHEQIDLIAYCLMPNHYHFLVRQNNRTGITDFIRAVFTNYATYFNQKYNSSGTIFQGKYKAALLETSELFIHVARYIHQNPYSLHGDWITYPYSSANHLKSMTPAWLKHELLLTEFDQDSSQYIVFVDQAEENDEELIRFYLDEAEG